MTNENPVVGVSGKKIIYDKDGKPCRSCNSLLDFQFAMGKKPGKQETNTMVGGTTGSKEGLASSNENSVASSAKTATSNGEAYARTEPADVEVLGRSSWTLLHSIAATYPETPSNKQQADMKQFLKLFGNFYPCWFCAEDFEKYMAKNEPVTETQDHLGRWLCDAHNEVNVKLGKPKFNCDLWKKRWKDGWDEETGTKNS